jgi:hypothetical protein
MGRMGRIKAGRIKAGRIKAGRIKAGRIKALTARLLGHITGWRAFNLTPGPSPSERVAHARSFHCGSD